MKKKNKIKHVSGIRSESKKIKKEKLPAEMRKIVFPFPIFNDPRDIRDVMHVHFFFFHENLMNKSFFYNNIYEHPLELWNSIIEMLPLINTL